MSPPAEPGTWVSNKQLRIAAMWVEKGKHADAIVSAYNAKIDSLRSLIVILQSTIEADKNIVATYDAEILNLGGQMDIAEKERDVYAADAKEAWKQVRKWKRRFVFGVITGGAVLILTHILR